MTIVDTSVWIEVFKRSRPLNLDSVVPFETVVTCLPIIQEVLQGFREERAFRIARNSFLALQLVEAPFELRWLKRRFSSIVLVDVLALRFVRQ